MVYRTATRSDLDLLASWNQLLIEDEGHRNDMDIAALRARMKHWLDTEYSAVIFSDPDDLAYALYRAEEEGVYLRQFYVEGEQRRKGVGTEAFRLLKSNVWPRSKRLTVDVLVDNEAAVCFWRSVGYKDYCLTLEIEPT